MNSGVVRRVIALFIAVTMTTAMTLLNPTSANALTQVTLDGLTYEHDGTSATVIGCSSCSTPNLVIPDDIEVVGSVYPVTAIGAGAFMNQTFGGTLALPSGLISVGNNAFRNSQFAGSLTLPNTLESVGSGAFAQNQFNGTLQLPSSLTTVEQAAFQSNDFDGSLSLPDNLTSVALGAFANNSFDGTLTLPSGLTSVGANAFSGNGFIGTLHLPGGLTEVGANAFATNQFSGTLTLPASLTSIAQGAFAINQFNGTLILSAGVTSIPELAFAHNLLSAVVVPGHISSIGDNAFANNSALAEVRFLGDAPDFGIGTTPFANTGSTDFHRNANAGGWESISYLGDHRVVAVHAPVIHTHPVGGVIAEGTPLTLSVAASLDAPVTYQWKKDGHPIAGATSSILNLGAINAGHAGSYTVEVTNWVGTTTSASATISVTGTKLINQSLNRLLPRILKKGKKYALPQRTAQNQPVSWKLVGKKYCSIKKKSKLVCKKTTVRKKKFKIRARAAGTAHLNAYQRTFKHRVR